nr:IMP cyclohydrolase [Oribacterium sp.]
GHFIHTYKENGNPIPTFEGEPERVAIPNTAEELKQLIWNNLNEDNKISLYVRYIDVTGRSVENKLVNKFEKIN